MSISWRRCETAKIPEIAFRALLTEGASEMELALL
jgi:hypothetical protein